MIKKLIAFSVYHPVSLVSVLLATSLCGLFCCFVIDADFAPRMSQREIIVSAAYSGLGSEDMERLMTRPLEDGLASMKGLKSSSSVTRSGLSLVRLELHWGTDIDLALVECRELVDLCYGQLPSRCEKPQVSAPSVLGEAMMVAVIPKDGDLRYGRYLVERDIKGRFQRLEGCGGVKVSGGEQEEVQVLVDYDRMEAKGLTLGAIGEKLALSNFQYPAGTIMEGDKEVLVKTSGLYESLKEMEDTPLLYDDLGLVRLSDVARVEMGAQERETFFLYRGQGGLCLSIAKAPDASPVVLSRQVYAEIEELRRQYGDFYDFVVLTDLSREVSGSLRSLGISALVGVVVAAAVILYFLRCWKISLLLSSLIPLCALHVLLALCLTGRSLNVMSLSGMAVGIGMVVDAGAVVLESLNAKVGRFRNSDKDSRESGGEIDVRPLVVEGTLEVSLSNTGSALTTAAVFVPLFFLQGLMGELFADLALAVIVAILASCVLSLSYIPALYRFLEDGGRGHRNAFLERLELRYRRCLEKIMGKKRRAVFSTLGCVLVALCCLPFFEYRLLPPVHENRMQAQLTFPYGTTLSRMEAVAGELYAVLAGAGLEEVAVFGGTDSADYEELSRPQQELRVMQVLITPPPNREVSRQEVLELLAGRGLEVTVSGNQDILSMILQSSGSVGGTSESFVVTLSDGGDDRERLERAAAVFSGHRLVPAFSGMVSPNKSGNEDSGTVDSARQLVFEPDRLAASRFSTNGMAVAQAANELAAGVESAPFFREGRSVPLRVQLSNRKELTATELSRLNVQLSSLRLPLYLLGNFREESAPEALYRYNRQPAFIAYPLETGVDGGDSSVSLSSSVDFDSAVWEEQGLAVRNLSEMENREMVGNGIVLLAVALLLLYLIMGAQFESFLIPLLLLLTLPSAFAGALVLTLVTGHAFSMNTVIALVVLFGTAVNNGILLYEGALLNGGFTPAAVTAASVSKLRTILVTNLTTIFALLPFAVDPGRTSSQSSLAVAVVGGLSLSMVLVLLVVPAVLVVYGKLRGTENG